MARKVLIQIRRGLEANIGTLEAGELGFCTDTEKLYIGTASGNALLVAAQTVGDMLKSIYDTNNDGVVDAAEDSAKLGGQLPAYYQQALGYTPVNKAGDTMTGALNAGISAGSPAVKGTNTFQTTNLLAGVAGTTTSAGEGYLGTFRNNATTGAGDVRAGVYGKQGAYSDGATNYAGFFEGRVTATGKITSAQTVGGDDDATLTTKKYVDDNKMPKGPLTWNDLAGV